MRSATLLRNVSWSVAARAPSDLVAVLRREERVETRLRGCVVPEEQIGFVVGDVGASLVAALEQPFSRARIQSGDHTVTESVVAIPRHELRSTSSALSDFQPSGHTSQNALSNRQR